MEGRKTKYGHQRGNENPDWELKDEMGHTWKFPPENLPATGLGKRACAYLFLALGWHIVVLRTMLRNGEGKLGPRRVESKRKRGEEPAEKSAHGLRAGSKALSNAAAIHR